jgi:hypothetical protein
MTRAGRTSPFENDWPLGWYLHRPDCGLTWSDTIVGGPYRDGRPDHHHGRNREMSNGFRRASAWLLLGVAAVFLLGINLVVAPGPASADPASARRILKAMSDYEWPAASVRALRRRLEIITPQIETIHLVASGDLRSAGRTVFVHRTGGYNDVQLFSNGQTATIVDTDNHLMRTCIARQVDQLINRFSNNNIAMPAADLLLTNSYDELMRDVLTAAQVGLGVVDGVECNHLAFRNADVDWQIWIRTGDRPLPCRYVITSKTIAGGPQYEVTFHDWVVNPATPGAFTYAPPSGSTQVPAGT